MTRESDLAITIGFFGKQDLVVEATVGMPVMFSTALAVKWLHSLVDQDCAEAEDTASGWSLVKHSISGVSLVSIVTAQYRPEGLFGILH